MMNQMKLFEHIYIRRSISQQRLDVNVFTITDISREQGFLYVYRVRRRTNGSFLRKIKANNLCTFA